MERAHAAEREEALLRADAALLREFAERDAVTVDGSTIAAMCAPQPRFLGSSRFVGFMQSPPWNLRNIPETFIGKMHSLRA